MRLWVTVAIDKIEGEDQSKLSEERVFHATRASLEQHGIAAIIGWEDPDWQQDAPLRPSGAQEEPKP